MVRGSSFALVALAVVSLVTLGACRGSRIETNGTSVAAGDTINGRLPSDRTAQSFSFEGVEGAVLDFTLRADRGNQAAPEVRLVDPDGKPVDLWAATTSARGAATMQARDVVLLRNGLYRLTVAPPMQCQETFYNFSHCLRFPTPDPRKVRLDSCSEQTTYVSAPRGGLIAFEIRPLSDGLDPVIVGVDDPWGGRALDKTQVPQGALPPRVSRGHLGEMVLTFTAPRPGKYAIRTASKPGTAGVAQLSVQVRNTPRSGRIVNHPNTLPHFGVPGGQSAAASPARRPAPPPPPTTYDPLAVR